MAKQLTFAENDFQRFRKPTRREKMLTSLNELVPWDALIKAI